MQKIVTGRYLESSTKALERKESVSGTICFEVKRQEQKMCQYAIFLRNPGNKIKSLKSLLDDWKKSQQFSRKRNLCNV